MSLIGKGVATILGTYQSCARIENINSTKTKGPSRQVIGICGRHHIAELTCLDLP